jgi:osmotically-inducible protein OsmY
MSELTRRMALTVGLLSAVTAAVLGTSVAAEQNCTKAAAVSAPAADRRATEEVRRRIAADETMSPQARQVEVTTSEGVVMLRGAIDSAEERTTLASLAESVPGVRRVEDRLQIRP